MMGPERGGHTNRYMTVVDSWGLDNPCEMKGIQHQRHKYVVKFLRAPTRAIRLFKPISENFKTAFLIGRPQELEMMVAQSFNLDAPR